MLIVFCVDAAGLASFLGLDGGSAGVAVATANVRGKQRRVEAFSSEPSSRGEFVFVLF